MKKKKYIPSLALVLLTIGVITFLVKRAARSNADLAELLTDNITYPVRRAFAAISDLFAFSFAELLIVISPILLALIIFIASRAKSTMSRIRFISSLLAVISLFYSVYVFTLGIGYHRTTVASRMPLSEVEVTRDNLHSTLLLLKGECEKLIPEIEFDESGSSVMRLDFDSTCDMIVEAYDKLEDEYPDLKIKNFDSNAKEVHFSKAMSAFEILGVYTFFTGESNVNVYYPDYTVPFTIAHELAHQRGISRENEANFIAFLVCIRSDDVYTRYSAYMNMFEYIASALSATDRELLREVYAALDDSMLSEMAAYREFYYANKNELMAKISDFFNDNYLKSQGTEGIVSYGLVVKLCVAYYAE